MDKPFQFKQFSVLQNRCAMKIGTDGVLLGAWTSLEALPNSILDIGAGTGIIALQLAQRSQAELIDAIEIDENAYEQCVENFEHSPWADRLFCYHADLAEFSSEMDNLYDLIVSNPPFYSEDYKSENAARDTARFNDALPFDELLGGVASLLSEQGRFAAIIPKKEDTTFLALAASVQLFPTRICNVQGSIDSEVKRCLLEFSFKQTTPEITSLIIEIDRHVYTQEYMELVSDFYLKM